VLINVACPIITLNPASLPITWMGAPYSQTVSASPVGGNYSFSATGDLPPGLTLNSSTGVISGAANTAGTFTFTITATGFGACPGSRAYTITVFQYVVQDNTTGDYLLFDSTTGAYYYRRCQTGLTLSGTGAASVVGCTVRLTVNNSTQRITVSLDKCKMTATATVTMISPSATYLLSDSNINNNTGTCPGS
jgi:hypothetical protein